MEKKKNLQIITGLNRGGAENHLLELCAGLKKNNFDVEVVVLRNILFLAPKFELIGVTVHCLAIANYLSLRGMFRLLRIIWRFRPDIVHAHLPPAELFAFLTKPFWKCSPRFVITKHLDGYFIDSLRLKLETLTKMI
ncbi:MAG: glycosyltransferase, partial [Fibrobacteres bacterium]|nr:glycosyltransferase [Fibrobacterota bacterium]